MAGTGVWEYSLGADGRLRLPLPLMGGRPWGRAFWFRPAGEEIFLFLAPRREDLLQEEADFLPEGEALMEEDGTVLLPEALRAFLGEERLVLAGMPEGVEVWPKSRWEALEALELDWSELEKQLESLGL